MTDPKKLAYDMGKPLLGGGLITKLAEHHKVTQNPANWWLVIHSIALAENAGDPQAYIGGILKSGTKLPVQSRIVERSYRKATPGECEKFRHKFGHDPNCGFDEVPTWWRG